MSWTPTYTPAPIVGCNPETIFEYEHYYDCKPHQHTRYVFTYLPGRKQTAQEAMHALLPVGKMLPAEYREEKMYYYLEEAVHALLHGDLSRARLLARHLKIAIAPERPR